MPPAGTLPARWQSGSIFSAKPQPAGSLIATACSDGVLRLWDLRSGSLANALSLPLFHGMTAACAWEPNGHCIASAATGGDICALVSFHSPPWSWHGLLASCISGVDQQDTPVMSSSRVRSFAFSVIEINTINSRSGYIAMSCTNNLTVPQGILSDAQYWWACLLIAAI